MKTFHVIITNKLGIYLEDDITYLSASSSDGRFGILPDYTSYISDLAICKLVLKHENDEKVFAISGGVLYIENNMCNIVVNSIESKDDIDLDRAYRAKKRAQERLDSDTNIDIKRANLALLRALNRINIKEN